MEDGIGLATVEAKPALEAALIQGWQSLSAFGLTTPTELSLFGFFRSVDQALTTLRAAWAYREVWEVERHIDALADQAACRSSVILGGAPFAADRSILIGAILDLAAALRTAADAPRHAPAEGVLPDIEALIILAERELEGWCPREKARYLARCVLQEYPDLCVAVGVHGGRAIVPCAAALRHNGVGVIYGIETWSACQTTRTPIGDLQGHACERDDLADRKHAFYRFVAAADLTQQVRLIEAPARGAACLFDRIDVLHLAGPTSVVDVTESVILYAQKVRQGGIVIVDDIDWDSAAPALQVLRALCDLVTIIPGSDQAARKDSCAIFRRR